MFHLCHQGGHFGQGLAVYRRNADWRGRYRLPGYDLHTQRNSPLYLLRRLRQLISLTDSGNQQPRGCVPCYNSRESNWIHEA